MRIIPLRHQNDKTMKQSIRESLNQFGLPIIQLKVMGKMCWFIVDTGSNVNLISSELKNELVQSLKSVGKQSTLGVGGDSENDVFEIPYSVDDRTFNALFGTLDGTFQMFEEEYGFMVSGLLGTEFMIRHRVIIDLSDGIIYMSGLPDKVRSAEKQCA